MTHGMSRLMILTGSAGLVVLCIVVVTLGVLSSPGAGSVQERGITEAPPAELFQEIVSAETDAREASDFLTATPELIQSVLRGDEFAGYSQY